jgi:hypothetical protein
MDKIQIQKLKGRSNWTVWKLQIECNLQYHDFEGILTGQLKEPEPLADGATNQQRKDHEASVKLFKRANGYAVTLISTTVDDEPMQLIIMFKKAREMWEKLTASYEQKSEQRLEHLYLDLLEYKKDPCDSIATHISKLQKLWLELNEESVRVDECQLPKTLLIMRILSTLPEEYFEFRTIWESVPRSQRTIDYLLERLVMVEIRVSKRQSDAAVSSSSALVAKGHWHQSSRVVEDKRKGSAVMKKFDRPKKDYSKIKCHVCHEYGHTKYRCPKNSDAETVNQVTVMKLHDDSDESAGLVVNHVTLSASSFRLLNNSWIVDSGATCHMCNRSELFVEFAELNQPLQIALGDGHKVTATGQGVVAVQLRLPDGKSKRCKLHDVLYVPALSYNLLSVSKAAERGVFAKFGKLSCEIFNFDGKLTAVATRTGSLYCLDLIESQISQCVAANALRPHEDNWHRRFGHLNLQSLKMLASNNMVEGLELSSENIDNFCEPCVKGKLHRAPFSVANRRADEPLGLVHTDVCGKLNKQSLSGAEYFLTFIDDKTRYVWVYFLKSKNEVFKRFVEWKTMAENLTCHKLKCLRSDNGGEYISAELESYLKSEGVRHELIVPKTPEQNGVAERMNRTLMEKVRSMLADARLPQKFWAEALSTAVYLTNRSPTKAVSQMTPYEAWTGDKPNVEHLRCFGCAAYAHIPKDERQKLDAKAKRCVFLGYGTEVKGYRLYDCERQKVFYSRDVLFNEAAHGIQMSPSGTEETEPVNVDCLNDSEPTGEPVAAGPEDTDSILRRSARERRLPQHYGDWINVANSDLKEPTTVTEVLSDPDKENWLEAMNKEMDSLNANNVWDLVPLPEGRKAVGSKWVFKRKLNADGKIERYKARLVAQGFSQKFGIDYDETFCPVVRHESVRAVIALAVQHGLKLHQMDIITAFLNGELKEEVYMRQPECFISKGQEHLFCRLKRSIYGLKQSPRCWNSALDYQLKEMGFVQSSADPCIYVSFANNELFIIAVYVDDMILAGQSDERIMQIKEILSKRFNVKDMGQLHYFLGMKVVQNTSGDVWIGQPAYAADILHKFHMDDAKPVSTPVDTGCKLVKATDHCERVDQQLYQSVVGSLLYLSIATRPDITFAVNNVAKYCADSTKQHWTAVKRIMRYLKGTLNFGLCYRKSVSDQCVGYSDADWAGDVDDRHSTSGYVFLVSGSVVSWKSKKQTSVALSTAEAEYVALASAAQEALWLRQLLGDLTMNQSAKPILIFEDNQSAIAMTKNPQYHGRSKHIDIKHHFVREQVEHGAVVLQYCPTENMIADLLTKGLSSQQFEKLRQHFGMTEVSMLPV